MRLTGCTADEAEGELLKNTNAGRAAGVITRRKKMEERLRKVSAASYWRERELLAVVFVAKKVRGV